MQTTSTSNKNLPKRSRYYQGLTNQNTIEKGANYKELKESFIIFICTFDPFHQGMAQYTFENLCLEDTELKLDDGAKKIFFNTNGYTRAKDEDVREFLKYVNGEKATIRL